MFLWEESEAAETQELMSGRWPTFRAHCSEEHLETLIGLLEGFPVLTTQDEIAEETSRG